MSFKEAFDNIPRCLKDIFVKRFGIAIVVFIAWLVVIFVADFYMSLPILALSLFFAISGAGMLFNCVTGNYVEVRGFCKNIELTSVKAKIKAIYVVAEDGKSVLKLQPKEGAKKFNVGDPVVVYIPARAMTTLNDGVYMVQEYYCMELTSKE